MSLRQQLQDDMKQALRDRDQLRLGAIRFLLADIKNVEIDNGELDDAGIQKIISKQVKQMKDAINDYGKGGRQDLVDEENKKVAVLEKYLPQQLSDEELKKIVESIIATDSSAKMGEIISQVMKQAAGQADGGRVAALVRQLTTS
jgi:uncharacterized protein